MPENDKPRRPTSWDCALLYTEPDQGPLAIIGGGGGRLGWTSRHVLQFVCVPVWAARYQRPSIRIKIGFPMACDQPAIQWSKEEQSQNTHYIEIILYAGMFTSSAEIVSEDLLARLPSRKETNNRLLTLMQFHLNEGSTTSARGLGTPFQAKYPDDDQVIHSGRPLEGVRSISEILSQTEFYVLVESEDLLKRARDQFRSDFGDNEHWFTGFPYSGE